MGNNASSQVDEAGGNDSRASSPLPGQDGDDGYDGLPRLDSSPAREFNVNFSQPVDGLPTFSPAVQQPEKTHKKSRKSHSRASSNATRYDHHDAEPENNDAASDDLEAIARNLKSEPESPETIRGKKKKRRKSKTQIYERTEDLHNPVPGYPEVGDDLPVVPEVSEVLEALEVPQAPEVPSATDEAVGMPAELHDDAPAPSSEPPSSRKKKKKKKAKTDKGNGPRLDLNEDPIAGSDDEVVIPSSEQPSRSRKLYHDEDGSSRKFRKRILIPTVSADVIESTQDNAISQPPHSASIAAAPLINDFLRRSREPEQYGMGEDNISPSVTRQERRTRLAPSRSASASPAEVPTAEEASAPLSRPMSESQTKNGESGLLPSAADEDPMDVDAFDPRLRPSVDAPASDDERAPSSDYSGDLPGYHDQDQAMEDDAQLTRMSQPEPDGVGFRQSLEDDGPIAMASTQPQPATDDKHGRSDHSSAAGSEQQERVLPETNGEVHDTRGHPAANGRKASGTSQRRSAQARAAAKESRMALQYMLDGSRDAPGADASDAAPESEAKRSAETGRGAGSSRPSGSNLLAVEPSLDHSNNQVDGLTMSHPDVSQSTDNPTAQSESRPATAQLPATQTHRVDRSSARSTPRGTRTYGRQPKPSFFERDAEDTAQAFAELPSNEVAATPQPAKPKTKRRLPIDIPDEESGPPPKRQRSSLLDSPKAAKASKGSTETAAAKNTPGRKKAPETAVKNSTGYLTGALTKTEVAQVEGAVEAFRADYGMEKHEVNAMIQQNPKDANLKDNSRHEELWSRIVEACPTRPRQKLLNWCRQKFHNFVARATWTPEQDAELRQMVQQHGTKWSVIGQLINRHQKDVRDRWRNYLVAGDNQRKAAWSEQEEKDFLEIVAEVLCIFQKERERDPDGDMFKTGKTNEELVDWNVVAERMKFTRSRLQCQEKWRRMREANKINSTLLAGQLEPDQRWRLRRARHEIASMSHADMYHIVLAIPAVDGGAKEDILINWKAILESQRKKYHRYTGMLLWSRLRQLVPDQENKNVQECAKELITMYQTDGGTFAIPGDEAFDKAQEEALLADIPPPRKRGPGKPKPGKGKEREGRASSEKRVVSEAFVHDSDSGEGEDANDADSSRANYNETSPAPPSGERRQNEEPRNDDAASIDLANDAGHDGRGASIDLAFDPANGGEQEHLDNVDPALEELNASPKPRKKSKSKSKAQDEKGHSSAKKHKKRYSGDMTVDLSPKKRNSGDMMLDSRQQGTPSGSANASGSRKRARADDAGTPNGSADPARKSKKAKRALQAAQLEQQAAAAEGAASSDDGMEDIPARLPKMGERQ